MKKSLIALAVLAASGAAMAQSSVTLSGIIKSGFTNTKYSDGAPGAVNGSGLAVADGSSQFWILGTEDLGGGLKAVFKIDTRFRVDDNGAAPANSPLATGNTFVGLTGNWGGIQFGKRDTHYCLGADTHGSRATALQASSCALLGYVQTGATNTAIANASRATNVVRYDLPNFSGLTGSLSYSTSWAGSGSEGPVGDAGKGSATALQLLYANGPINAGISLWNAKSENRTAGAARGDQTAYTLTGGYNFGFATLGLTYDVSKVNGGLVGAADSEFKRNVWSIPVTVPVGAGTILFTYSRASDAKLNGATVTDSGANLWTLGYDYALSKRTSVGVNYTVLNNKTNAAYNLYTQTALAGHVATTAGQDAKQLYVGIRHAF